MSEEERIAIVKESFTYALYDLRIAMCDLIGVLFGEPTLITNHKNAIQREQAEYVAVTIRM